MLQLNAAARRLHPTIRSCVGGYAPVSSGLYNFPLARSIFLYYLYAAEKPEVYVLYVDIPFPQFNLFISVKVFSIGRSQVLKRGSGSGSIWSSAYFGSACFYL